MTQSVVLITGATGLLGQQLITTFLNKGYRIIACRRISSDISPFPEHPRLSWVDIADLLNNKQAIKHKVDYVIHAAGLVSYQAADAQRLFHINAGLTKEIVELCIFQQVKRLIYVSSIAALGKHSSDAIITETTVWNDSQFASNYGRSKRAGEEAVRQGAKRGLKYVILNPSVIIGPSKLGNSSSSLFKYVLDEKPFYTNGYINYVDVRDVSEVINSALTSLTVNSQFIVNAGYTTYNDFFHQIANKLQKRAPTIAIPSKLVIIGALIERLWAQLTKKAPFLSLETAKMAGKKYIYDANKLKQQINYSYFSLNESIEHTVEKMKKNEYIKL